MVVGLKVTAGSWCLLPARLALLPYFSYELLSLLFRPAKLSLENFKHS